MATGANTVANLQNQLTAGLAQLNNLGINVNGGGAANTGAANAAANANAQTAATIQQLTGQSARGQQVAVIKDNAQGTYRLAAPTGQSEKVVVAEVNPENGQLTGATKTLLFDASGKNVRNFEVADRATMRVDLDRRQGIATGINNLTRVIAGRQERLKSLTEALAQDSNENGSTNQVDIQRLVQEQQVTEHLSNMNHKIYESVQNSISAWLR